MCPIINIIKLSIPSGIRGRRGVGQGPAGRLRQRRSAGLRLRGRAEQLRAALRGLEGATGHGGAATGGVPLGCGQPAMWTPVLRQVGCQI